MAGDFIPHRDGSFLEWAKNLLTYVNTKLAAFNIPAGATAEIQPLLTAYDTAFQAAQSPNWNLTVQSFGKYRFITGTRETRKGANRAVFTA